MPVLPGPTIPYPDASGAQACADWCASTLAAQRSHIAQEAAALSAIHAWVLQRQWVLDGGCGAPYPLPLASGPAVALALYGPPGGPPSNETPTAAFFASPAWGSR